MLAYYSKLNKYEQLYSIALKELFAVVSACEHFHPYLYDQDIVLRTDNAAANWMRNRKNPTGLVARWLQELGTYNMTVVHRPGTKHTNADVFSRRPCKACKRQQDINAEDNVSLETGTPTDSEPHDQGQIGIITRSKDIETEYLLSPNMGLLSGWEPDPICLLQLKDKNIYPNMTHLMDGNDRPAWTWGDSSHLSASANVLWKQ